ncbi:dTDP-4-dehydrorhamnose reductase [Winogradskyella sp. UBA3174]|uniref:dTDP-4-dehydrorhamnose reductase n=1 Tax=Winogradskyella sp. UBA3174 TaxID=1947785 RepID=UPI0025EBA0EC|nr:dTDP-4-dehydrorhamnose reductase [Winogradskyella sp. UBA3174]|tara:strand:+ start:55588 stop:56448 length:861 start_codon:yes stop_codon:yes gene_type:complete
MKKILVTGGNGQLATCIKAIEKEVTNLHIVYTDSSNLNITNSESVDLFFSENSYDFCINCAAYTAVDLAEKEEGKAILVNETGVKNLALACDKYNTVLIHVSTDFVFDGYKNTAYNENDQTNPRGIYGVTKLKGEFAIREILTNYFIIRTSWLYSEYGNNFMKTMLRVSKDRNEISVVDDQIGTPTYAIDLAMAIFKIINIETNAYGIYNYSNEGVASWYDFACAIFDECNVKIDVKPIKTVDYPTPAERPKFSVLNKSKLKSNLNISIPHWRDSLRIAMRNFNSN